MNAKEMAVTLRSIADQLDGAVGGNGPPPTLPSNTPPPHLVFADIPVQYRHAEPGPYPGRYDEPLPEGTVGSVKMLVTGHVLSMAQPQYDAAGKLTFKGETIVPYVRRVRYQITANPDGTRNEEKAQQVLNVLGFLMQSSSTLKSLVVENPDTWPFAADEFINKDAYFPVDPAEAAASIKQWSDGMARVREEAAAAGQVPPVVPPTGPTVEDPPIAEG